MDTDQKIGFVFECLVGEQSIPAQLRMKRGLNEERFTRLISVLQELTGECAGGATIDKRLAFAFVDIRTAFDGAIRLYSGAVAERIEDAAEQLVDLAYGLFSTEDRQA